MALTEAQKAAKKRYNEKNKEIIKQKKHEYYEAHKDTIKERVAEYKLAHQEELKAKQREYDKARYPKRYCPKKKRTDEPSTESAIAVSDETPPVSNEMA